MLTLFPRSKPNPLPPPLPPGPVEANPVPLETIADAAPPIIQTASDASNSGQAAAIAILQEAPQPVAADATAPASSVTDSDLFAAFMSGLATGNSDPFIVEITAQPSSKATPELSESEQLPSQAVSLPPESPTLVEELSAGPSESESVETGAAQSQLAPRQDAKSLSAHENSGDSLPSPQLYIAAANIFDELDILHEAGTELVELAAAEPQEAALAPQPDRAPESPIGLIIEDAEPCPQATIEESGANPADTPSLEVQVPASAEIVATETAAPSTGETTEQSAQVKAGASDPGDNQSALGEPEPEPFSIETASPRIAPLQEVQEPAAPQQARQEPPEAGIDVQSFQAAPAAAPEPQEQEPVALTTQPLPQPSKKAAFGAPLSPAKPKRAKGTFFELARVAEPEAMEDSGEVEAYASAAAQSHLDAIDDTLVAHAQLLLKSRERGRALDIGTGPGQIVIKLGYRLTLWKFVGIDRSAAMIEKARESLSTAGELAGRVEFRVADGNALDFPDKTFDLVVCNSVLHHIAEPHNLFTEIARVVKPGGAILLRDLRRPSRWGYSYHVWKHGKYYAGEMRRLFMASVMAAYTEEELQKLVASSALRDVRVFRHGKTHIGFERPIANGAERKR